MSREIKFRVWNKCAKCYVMHLGEMETTIAEFDLLSLSDYLKRNSIQTLDSFIIQQYTGIKDESGTEIYEGDIIKFLSVYPSCTKTDKELIGRVIHDGKNFVLEKWVTYYTTPRYEQFLLSIECYNNMVKVVGNIFENKDLMD